MPPPLHAQVPSSLRHGGHASLSWARHDAGAGGAALPQVRLVWGSRLLQVHLPSEHQLWTHYLPVLYRILSIGASGGKGTTGVRLTSGHEALASKLTDASRRLSLGRALP